MKMINLVYIKAAIEAATGVRLRLKDVGKYLVEEGLITKDQAAKAVFYGYESFNSDLPMGKKLSTPVPVDQEIAKWNEPIEKEEGLEEDE